VQGRGGPQAALARTVALARAVVARPTWRRARGRRSRPRCVAAPGGLPECPGCHPLSGAINPVRRRPGPPECPGAALQAPGFAGTSGGARPRPQGNRIWNC